MFTTAVLFAVAPVKYTLPFNVNTSTEFGINDRVDPTTVVLAIVLAALAVSPNPRYTTTEPVLCTRYCVPPIVVDTARTGVGAVTVAVKLTVFPIGVKAMIPIR
jgi:hypothetical protein